MDDYQNEAMPVGAAEVAAATQTLQRYKAGKAALDRRLVDNELWFRMGHWKNCENNLNALILQMDSTCSKTCPKILSLFSGHQEPAKPSVQKHSQDGSGYRSWR